MITIERLRFLTNYDVTTGIFTWKISRRGCKIGSQIGCVAKTGYRIIRLDNVLYLAHRLAWFYVYGIWPTDQIDHINGDRLSNCLVNLREATNMQNAHNRFNLRKNNKSGFVGVRKENNKWLAEIKVNYAPIRLGLFDTPEEASQAYIKEKHIRHPFSRR
jgi:hypothetical protein